MLGPLALRAVSAYARHAPLTLARWRVERLALKLSRTYGPDLGLTRVRTRSGLQMDLDLGDWVDQHVYAVGLYEVGVAGVAASLLTAGATAVDIGANIGFFSLLFGQLVGPSGRVLAFEPQPRIVDRLVRNVGLNPNLPIQVDARAVSDAPGRLEFFNGSPGHSGIASLRRREDASDVTTVEVVALDEVLGEDHHVQLIKIDIEGAELHALRGMQRTIEKCSPDLIVEVSDHFLRGMGGSGRELCEHLWQYGYTMYVIDYDGCRQVGEWSDSLPAQFNALFTKRSKLPL